MLTYELARSAEECLYVQLYQHIRADIERGALSEGEKLPSKRVLAQHLGVSLITVENAFRQLVAEGYVRVEQRRGFFVCPVNVTSSLAGRSEEEAFPKGRNQAVNARSRAEEGTESDDHQLLADLTGATPPTDIFPYAAWARTMRTVLSTESERTMLRAAGAQGSAQLRSAIADHLRGFRGMDVNPDQVVIGSGAQSLYGLVVQLLGRDRTFAIEDPGYPRLRRIYQSNDVLVATVRLDEGGPILEDAIDAGVTVLHCMPSHQFPTGITTPVGRRQELLEWASHKEMDGTRRYAIEDDYDCEFRMAGRPVPALITMDEHESVIYANTFTKTLGAAFRIGYLVLPPHLADAFRERLGFYACTVGALEQLTLARFISSGQYERHVSRQRTSFRHVQDALIRTLSESVVGQRLRFRNVGAGLHFVMEIPDMANAHEEHVAACALKSGVALAPLGRYFVHDRAERPCAFVMSYASLKEALIPQVVAIISEALSSAIWYE